MNNSVCVNIYCKYKLNHLLDYFRPVSRLEESMRQMLMSKKESRQRLAKSVKTNPSSSSVFITQLSIDNASPNEISSGEHKRGLRTGRKRNSNRTTAAPSLLQQARMTPAVTSPELDQDKLQLFKDLRDQQRRLYHRYLK